MIPTISEFFNNRAYGRQFLQLFEQMARTITEEYIQDIVNFIETNGSSPSFEELMQRVRSLNDELMMRATWIREDYREDRGRRSIKLTTGCKRIIKASVAEFLTRSKTITSIRHQQVTPPETNHLLTSNQ